MFDKQTKICQQRRFHVWSHSNHGGTLLPQNIDLRIMSTVSHERKSCPNTMTQIYSFYKYWLSIDFTGTHWHSKLFRFNKLEKGVSNITSIRQICDLCVSSMWVLLKWQLQDGLVTKVSVHVPKKAGHHLNHMHRQYVAYNMLIILLGFVLLCLHYHFLWINWWCDVLT